MYDELTIFSSVVEQLINEGYKIGISSNDI